MEKLEKYNDLMRKFFRRKIIQKKQVSQLSNKYQTLLKALNVFRKSEHVQAQKIENMQITLQMKALQNEKQKTRIEDLENREASFRQRIGFLEDYIETLTESGLFSYALFWGSEMNKIAELF